MKSIVTLIALFSVSPVIAQTKGTVDNPVFTQCTVELPTGTISGFCMEVGEKYYQVLNCKGELQAFVAPDALPRVDEVTCGPEYVGYPVQKKN